MHRYNGNYLKLLKRLYDNLMHNTSTTFYNKVWNKIPSKIIKEIFFQE